MNTRYILFILMILLSVGCKSRNVKSIPATLPLVKVAAVTSTEISIPVHSTGALVSSEELKLSFKTGGIVAGIYVKEGEHVKKGELLASINLSEVNSNAEQAKNAFDKALRDYNRAENLYRDSVATLEQKQNAATALNMARSTLDIVQFNLAHSRIIAPDNGLILKQLVKQNEMVSSGYPVFLFGSSGKFWKVRSGLSDKDVVKVNQGDSAVVSFDAYPGVKFSAIVDLIGEISNPFTGTYETELLLKTSNFRLASGFVAGVEIYPASKRLFSFVPVGSIVEADGLQGYIYILKDKDIVQKVKIEIENFMDSMVAVKGIPAGTSEVVSEGAAYLRDGVNVIVVK
jgi:membrane fusion protein, multidrug efflux system